MSETQEELLTVEEAQEQVKAESVYPGDADTDETPAEEKTDKPETEETEEDKDETLTETEEAKEEKPEDAETEEEAETEETDEEEQEKIKFKYKSQEEAEKGRIEAERKMHEATKQVKQLKEEIEAIKKETSQAVKDGEITKKDEATLKNIFVDMLSSIDELDPSDDNYREKLAEIWANGLGEGWSIKDKEREAALQAKEKEEIESRKIVNQANTMAKKAGLDMDFITDDNGNQISTVDYDLFWNIVAKSELVGKTVEDRINWVIEEVKSKRSMDKEKILTQQKILSEKQKEAQNKNKVLEKGVTVIPEKKKDEAPLSITEALSRIERRV